jgi:pyridoxamine 5'-phosphate oxidase family protein
MASFTDLELAYLESQRLGRLATVARDGGPQNNPVGFRYKRETDTVEIYGFNLGQTRKFRNVQANPKVSLVIDDIASVDPWKVRGVEIRGTAEALVDQGRLTPTMSPEVIRVHPHRVISWGL